MWFLDETVQDIWSLCSTNIGVIFLDIRPIMDINRVARKYFLFFFFLESKFLSFLCKFFNLQKDYYNLFLFDKFPVILVTISITFYTKFAQKNEIGLKDKIGILKGILKDIIILNYSYDRLTVHKRFPFYHVIFFAR